MIYEKPAQRPRQPLRLAGHVIGSLEPEVAQVLHGLLAPQGDGWQMDAPLDRLALARKTREEAGRHLHQLRDVAHAGIRRPSGGSDGVGYTVEQIDWFRCTVPTDMVPANQDGEVERFEAVDRERLEHDVATGRYTLEAALILAPDRVASA